MGDPDEGIILRSIARHHRLILLILVFIPRFFITLALAHFGSAYLAYTLATEDLILNACALQIVSNIDELLFEAIGSVEIQQAVQKTSLRVDVDTVWPSSPPFLKLVSQALVKRLMGAAPQVFPGFFRLVLLLMMVLRTCYSELFLFRATVTDVRTRLCGNDQNFVYTIDGDMPVFSTLDGGLNGQTSFDSGSEMFRCIFAAQDEMLRMYAGFPPLHIAENQTLTDLVRGTSSACQGNGGEYKCPVLAINDFQRLETAGPLAPPPDCADRNVAFDVIRSTCLHSEYYSPWINAFLLKRVQCSDVTDLCTCPEALEGNRDWECTMNATTAELLASFELPSGSTKQLKLGWFFLLRRICPSSCGACPSPLGGEGRGEGKGRG